MINKYKYILLSLGSYIAAVLWFGGVGQIGTALVKTNHILPYGDFMNTIALGVFFILVILGIFFGFKSNKAKESSWAGNLLMVIGIVVILGWLLLRGACGPSDC